MSLWPVAAASSIALKLDTRKRNCSNLEQTVHCKPIQVLIQTSWFMKLSKKNKTKQNTNLLCFTRFSVFSKHDAKS